MIRFEGIRVVGDSRRYDERNGAIVSLASHAGAIVYVLAESR